MRDRVQSHEADRSNLADHVSMSGRMKSDLQLLADVNEELKWEPSVMEGRIVVAVKDGVVTLAGQVGSCFQKWRAETAVRRVHGVVALVVEIETVISAIHQRSDAEIGRTVAQTLEAMTLSSECEIQIMVEGGWVTVAGDARWQFQRDAVERAIRNASGITGLSNNLTIKPKVSSESVKENIEAALKRLISFHLRGLHVDVVGGEVTLTGTAATWSDHEDAINAAWWAAGVQVICDRVAIAR